MVLKRLMSMLLVLSLLCCTMAPALAGEVSEDDGTEVETVCVSTPEALVEAVSEASGDTIIDLTEDITIGLATSLSNTSDSTITITSSNNSQLILNAKLTISAHIAMKDFTVLCASSYLIVGAFGILDIYNSYFGCTSTYLMQINDADAIVNIYSGTFATEKTYSFALTKGTMHICPTGKIEISGTIYQQANFLGWDIIPQTGFDIKSAVFNNEDILNQLSDIYSIEKVSSNTKYLGLTIKMDSDEDDPPPPTEYTIDTNSVDCFSSITIDGAEANRDGAKATEGQEVKVKLSVPTGYEITSYSCTDESGQDVSIALANNVLTFTMPASAVTVSVQTKQLETYTLTPVFITNGNEGDMTGRGKFFSFAQNGIGMITSRSVYEGDTINVTYQVADGYFLSKLTYTVEGGKTVDLTDQVYQDGFDLDRIPYYSAKFTMPAGNVTVTLEFTNTAQRRVICQQPDEGGSISVDKELVTNDTINVFPAPKNGYRVSSVEYSLDDGETWSSVQFLFGNGERVFWITPTASTSTDPILVRASFANNTTLSISDEQGLRDLAEAVNYGDWHEGVTVTLENDITLHGLWTPIGNDSGTDYTAFAGTFDGCGHTVSGLSIDPSAKTMGLFGTLYEGTVKNLTVEGKITATGMTSNRNIGSIVVSASGSKTLCQISNCVSRVDIDLDMASASSVGGIVGSADSVEISDCVNWGNIDAVGGYNGGDFIRANDLGGIVGTTLNYTASIVRCANYGKMTCDAGEHSTTSSTTGASNGERWLSGSWGGIVGWANSGVPLTLDACFNRGSMTGDMDQSGGLIGYMNSGYMNSGYRPVNIINCYNAGALTSIGDHNYQATGGRMGGLLGQADSQSYVMNSYSSGEVTVEVPPSAGRGVFSGPLWSVYSGKPRNDNCYSSIDIAALPGGLTPAILNPKGATVMWNGEQVPIWKEDLATDANGETIYINGAPVHVNGGTPMLYWESTLLSGETETVRFTTTPAGADVTVYAESGMDEASRQAPDANGTYALYNGLTYYYKVSAQGYVTATGSFTVNGSTTVAVELKPASVVTFRVTPSTAEMTVTGGNDVAYDSRTAAGNTVEYVYTLVTGTHYIYSADADGYAGTTREFTADGNETITLTLEKSNYGAGENVKYIYGTGNTGQPNTITSADSYSIGAGATGTITIDADGPVTLIGRGTKVGQEFKNLYINCAAGTTLILEQVYISNEIGTASMIDFTGSGNKLIFSYTNILDQNTGATGYAMIHVGSDTSLTLESKNAGAAYLYKREQGAAIGGHGSGGNLVPEYNGDITISGLDLFIKGSKQGALIGGGAGVGKSSTIGTPGRIAILGGSDLNLIPNAQGAAIGSGSGSENSIGPDVVVRDSKININVNFDAAAIGGGGYKANKDDDVGANESDGGTLTCEGNSSIRAYIGQNGIASWGVKERGVNGNIAITANVVDSSGQQLYLLELDTSKLSGSNFTITDELNNGKEVYSGGLHQWGYVNETLTQDKEKDVSYTIDNWVRSADPHLYLYLTGAPHKLAIGSATVDVTWNGSAFAYEIKNAAGDVIASGGGASVGTDAAPEETEETEIPAATTVSEGTAITKVDSDALAAQLEHANAETQILIKPEISTEEAINKATTILIPDDVAAIADAKASLKVSTPLADIVLSNAALQDVAAGSGPEAEQVTITAEAQENGTRIEVAVDEKVLDKVVGGLLITLPVAGEELSAGSVMVLVDSEGSETVIKKSILDEAGVTALLDGSCTVKVIDNAASFSDIEQHWASDAIDFVSSRELFNGVDEGVFDPNGNMTRSMLATVLHRLEDTPDTAVTEAYGDVLAGTWYTDSVHWASENGIVNGMGDGTFAPNISITREQMATMIYRYADFLGLDTSSAVELSGFADSGETSDWAAEALQWAVSVGLVEGKDNHILDPKGTATRAEVAAILQRLIAYLLK